MQIYRKRETGKYRFHIFDEAGVASAELIYIYIYFYFKEFLPRFAVRQIDGTGRKFTIDAYWSIL